MSTYFHVRVDQELKDRFIEVAKANGSDASTEIRLFMSDYVRKHAHQAAASRGVYDKLYDAGYALQQKLGDQESRKLAWKLNNFILTDINGFMQELLKACLGANFTVPNELLDASRNPSLAQAFVAGLYGEGRGESE